MALVILGVILLITGIFILKQKEELHKLGRGIRSVGAVLIIIGALNACVKQIDAGQIGVTSLFGKVSNEVLTPGLNFVNPLVSVYNVDIKTLNYTMSGVHNEGEKEGDDAIRVLTSDGLEVTIDLTVLYRVVGAEAPRLIKETGLDYKDKIVRPLTRTKIRDNAVYFTAIDLYSTQKMEFVLQKEKQEAERKRVEAQGIADYQRIISTGLNDKQLQYEQIQMMKGLITSPNSKVIVMGKGNTPVILDSKDK